MYNWARKKINCNVYKEEIKKRMNEVNGKITERVKKIREIMLDAAKISVPKKKLNKRNKPNGMNS